MKRSLTTVLALAAVLLGTAARADSHWHTQSHVFVSVTIGDSTCYTAWYGQIVCPSLYALPGVSNVPPPMPQAPTTIDPSRPYPGRKICRKAPDGSYYTDIGDSSYPWDWPCEGR